MNKEEINLLSIQLYLEYYKKDITDRYARCTHNFVLDSKVLNSMDEKLFITTLDNHIKLQQRINKAIEYINHFSKKSEVKINGLPDCKVFIGDIEQLLEILKGSDVDDNRDMERH